MNAYSEEVEIEGCENRVRLEIGAPSSKELRDVGNIMKEATIQQFSNFDNHQEEILQYGCLAGNTEFKTELAKYLSEMYRNPVDSGDLFINAGSSQGVTNLLCFYFNPGDTIFIDDPAFWALLGSLELFGFHVVSVNVDENGMILSELEKHLDELKARELTDRYPYKAAVYVTPTYQNPTTVCMSEGRCKKLVDLARRHDLLVVADDVYNLLTYSAPDSTDPTTAKPPVRLIQYDDKADPNYKGSVVSVGTFSKLLGPGLRLGWFEMPKKAMLAHFLQVLASAGGGGRSPYISGLVTVGLKNGTIPNHVSRIRRLYADRMTEVHEIITKTVGSLGVKCVMPRGGIFLWIQLPGSVTAAQVLERCGKEISFVDGQSCSLSGGYANTMRICISFYENDVLCPAVQKLCNHIKEVVEDGKKTAN